MAIDDSIPFVEYFVVPYFLWFGYVAAAVAYFFFKNKHDFYRLCGFLAAGMTIFLVVSTIYPHAQTGKFCTWQHFHTGSCMALCYRYTDESLSEYSCLQLLRCPYCRDEEWMFPWKEEDKICFLTVMCQHHFIDDVLKTTFLFWCDHCICNGRYFLLFDLYEISCCWGILWKTVPSYLGTIHHNHIWNKNIKYQKKKSWSQGNTISIFL